MLWYGMPGAPGSLATSMTVKTYRRTKHEKGLYIEMSTPSPKKINPSVARATAS
jgi:hypothetical protein